MALFDKNRFRALASAFMLSAVLTGCGGGGGAAPNPTFTSGTQNQAQITNLLSAGGGNDAVDIAGDTVSDIGGGETGLAFEGFLDGLGGDDEVRLVGGGRVASIAFSDQMPTSGELHLQRYEIITIIGGMVDGLIDASGATTAITFDLRSGRVGPTTGTTGSTIAITGSPQNDIFIISGDLTGDTPALDINGAIVGGGGTADEVRLVAGGVVSNINFSAFTAGELNLQDVEVITIDGGTVNNNISTTGFSAAVTFNLTSGTITGGVLGTSQADIFNLESGTITGDVNGGGGADSFVIGAGITIGGTIDGGGADADTLSLATGFTPTAANLFGGVLTLGLTGGGSLALTLANIATDNIDVGTLTLTMMMLPAPGDGMMPVVPSRTTLMGTSGVDTPTLDSSFNGGDSNYNYDAGGGNDMITISGSVDGNVLGGAGMDTFILSGGMVGGNLEGGAEADTFRLISGTVTGNIDGGADNDRITVTGGVTFGGTIDGGAGDEDRFVWGINLTADSVSVSGTTFTLAGGPHDGTNTVPNPTGFEIFVLGGGTITGDYTGRADAVDAFEYVSGVLRGTARGGTGAGDTFSAANAAAGVTVTNDGRDDATTDDGIIRIENFESITLSGFDDTFEVELVSAADTTTLIDGGAGVDRFVWGRQLATTGVTVGVVSGTTTPEFQLAGTDHDGVIPGDNLVPNPRNFEIFVLGGGTIGAYTGSANDDRLELLSGSVTGAILMEGGNDRFTVTDGVSFTSTIDGGAGTGDRFVWGAGLTTTGVNLGTTAGAFTFAGTNHGGSGNTVPNPTGFEIFVLGGGTVGGYTGSANADRLELLSGSVTGNIDSAGGNDTITLSGGTLTGNVLGGTGDDTFIIAGDITGDSPALTINGVIDGAGTTADEFQLNAGAVVASVAFANTAPTGGALNLQNIETITLNGGTVTSAIDASAATTTGVTFNLMAGVVGPTTGTIGSTIAITGSPQNDIFIISGDLTGDTPALDINGLVEAGGGTADEVRLIDGAVVESILFSNFQPGRFSLQGIETITINGDTVMVTGNISATGVTSSITFNLRSGTIMGDVVGSPVNDIFNLYAGIMIVGQLDGNNNIARDDVDTLNYAGATTVAAGGTALIPFNGCGGIGADTDIRDNTGPVFNIESQGDLSGGGTCTTSNSAGLRGLTVRGIEVLGLSPALNLYGAMSDALMQFGAQTAQGFALADLNLATGRATSLVSKDSPFTKGRIWAHKITHSGNGKGSIGLNLTGLTARADSDYDYEMSLTQHGFDAPLATTRLGAFNLRAVSHTMTGVIETNVAEANVSGYGAGVALLWNSGAVARQRAKRARAPIISAVSASAHHHHGLSAHITSLAGAYEVEAHTSPLNPRAVVNEVSEGSFSAINAVVSAGIADTRKIGHSLVLRTTADLVWQTLSLDDFSETGADGIIINFDKATRFTARVGAGLESEHWFSDVAFVHETSSGGTLSSGLEQDYRQDDGTAIEMKLGGKLADLATGLTLKAYAGLRTSLTRSDAIDPSAHLALNWRF